MAITKPTTDLTFIEGSAEASDSSSIVRIGREKKIEFYYTGEDEPGFFISPKLELFYVGGDIAVCNFNKKCETGEDYNNCRNDCSPVWPIIIYSFLVLLLFLVLYTAAQIWYKKRYETYLFKDRRHLFNLISFIDNAKARKIEETNIVAALKEKGWSGEQIIYAIKKSKGERTGMYELIPVEWVSAYFRHLEAKKAAEQKITKSAPVNPSQTK